jgi:hypothetical protein
METMWKTMAMMLVAAGMTIGATNEPASAQSKYCVAALGCVPSNPARYDACFQLALQRGINVSRGDSYSRTRFMFDCLAGRIPFTVTGGDAIDERSRGTRRARR